MVWPTVQTGLNCSAGALLRFVSNRFQLRTLKQIVNAFTFRRGKREFLLTMLVPLPWRLLHVHSLSLSYGAYGVFLVLVEQHHHFPSSGLDDVCGFFDGVSRTMGSTVGHLASPQLLLYKMELFCDSRSRTRTRYTHTNTHAILLLLLLSRRVADLQERKKSLSGSSEEFSGRRNQKELLADTRTHGKLLYAHGKLSLVTASPWLSKN